MVILGLADGADAGAALVIGDRLVAVHPATGADPASDLPWQAAAEVLGRAGLSETDVDLVAIAGRYTPPLAARRRPQLRGRAADPFSAPRLVGALTQRILRGTGLGAVDADRATEFFEQRLRDRGYRPRRVVLVDVHRCLAAAAYRCQPRDDATVLVLHPRGDGALATIHRGRAGQIDRVAIYRGGTGVHLWLDRCLAAADLAGPWTLDGAGAAPDRALLQRLAPTLSVDAEGQWHARRLARQGSPPWSDLAALGPRAASTIAAHLRRVVLDWATGAIRAQGAGRVHIALAGAWLRDPRLIAELAELGGVESVSAGPWLGGGLAIGAAVAMGGTAPHRVVTDSSGEGIGAPVLPPEPALGEPLAADDLSRRLARGEPVARFVGRDPLTPHGSGARSVVVRADDPAAVARAREALSRPADEVPVLVGLPDALPVPPAREAMARAGVAAVRAPDGALPRSEEGWVRIARPVDPALAEALRGRDGDGAVRVVAAFPLGQGSDRPVTSALDAVETWRLSGLPSLQLGDRSLTAPVRE